MQNQKKYLTCGHKLKYNVMRRFISLIALLLMTCGSLCADSFVLGKLKQIPQISDIQELKVDPFNEYYQFCFEQPIDHADPGKGTFKQRVLLGHRAADAPVVVELEGYFLFSKDAGELSTLFDGNQLTIEHRFFDESVPADGIPWEYLTIRQAADDQHAIIQAIKQNLYPASKWISTGISKGGQTTIFHRYFYPEDVDISVPYVAPLNLEYVDPRLGKFLDKLGTAKGGFGSFTSWDDLNAPHWTIRDFQILCFEHQDTLAQMLEAYATEHQFTYNAVGGVKRALQLVILEYPFAFWQWGRNPADIPTEETAEWDEIFKHLLFVSDPSFFEDKYLERMRPFFYAALTETGMYEYNIKPFKKYMPDEKGNIDFSFAYPEGMKRKPFNSGQMEAINTWLQTDAERILFVYGGSDPWFATAVDLKKNDKCRRYIRGDKDHTCRIKDIDPVSREDLIETLKGWLAE